MWGFIRNGRELSSKQRHKNHVSSRRRAFQIECLDDRVLLSATVAHPAAVVGVAQMADEGQTLISVYEASSGGTSTAGLATQFPMLQFKGSSVFIHVNLSGNMTTALSSLTSLGFQTVDSSAFYGAADGYAPISALPQIAVLSQLRFASPNYKPILNPTPTMGLSVAVKPASTPLTVAPRTITVVPPAPVKPVTVSLGTFHITNLATLHETL